MGCNYYAVRNICTHCGRGDAREHVGKSSVGWRFSFHTDEGLPRSWQEWKERLSEPGTEIRNEYGERVPLEELEALIVRKKGGRDHVALSGRAGDFHDPEGHPFSLGEFS